MDVLDIDANRSLWVAAATAYEPRPPLGRDATADIAIIGGGLTGVSSAYHFSRRFPEKRIVLLEALLLANGASGRNGGLMLNWIAGVDSFDDPELTRRIYDTTRAGIDLVEGIIREHRLRVRYRRDGCLEVHRDPRRAENACAVAERLNSWGIPVRFLHGRELADCLGRAERRWGSLGRE